MKNESGNGNAWMLRCEGWWEQIDFGRQPMLNLRIQVAEGRIAGSGTDMIGPFTFSGALGEAGQVVMFKQYIGRHGVDYLGSYDGEGTMWGHWRIGVAHGRWLITFRGGVTDTAAIHELVPTACRLRPARGIAEYRTRPCLQSRSPARFQPPKTSPNAERADGER